MAGLREALGWKVLSVGEALRARAEQAPDLRAALGSGRLAPEAPVLEIVVDAVREAGTENLVIDGFPRHRDQVSEADRLLGSWRAILLEIDSATAAERLHRRVQCMACGIVVAAPDEAFTCPQCGASAWQRRPEDRPETVAKRIAEASLRLTEMIPVVESRGARILRVDGTREPKAIVEAVRMALVDY
jgi:adenylate kinase